MYLLVIGIFLSLIGAIMSIRGTTSRFNPPSGGGSRIPPEAQVRLNESVQKVAGTNESYNEYYKGSNVFSFNKLGALLLIIGVLLIIAHYVI